MPKPLRSRRLLAAVGLLGVTVFAIVLLFGAREPKRTRTPEAIDADDTPWSDPANVIAPTAKPTRSSVARPLPSAEHDGHDDDRHPHPITPEHVRIQNDNQMLGALNDATDVKDVARLRQLIEAWKAKHDDDPEKFADAYTVIADCLEFHNEESRAKAKRFYDENRWSTLRRHVRRHCF